MTNIRLSSLASLALVTGVTAVAALDAKSAAARSNCGSLPSQSELRGALVAATGVVNLTLNNDMWATIVAKDGTVCAVAFSGTDVDSQWLLSRIISAQKANTANGLSLKAGAGGDIPGLAFSTANLYSAVQPGGSLYGLQHSNPVDPELAYGGSSSRFGRAGDPLVGKKVGGVNVFGGGLALYDQTGERVGGLGVSGDTSCRDHMVAWETRANLALDFVPAGLSGDSTHPDNIIFDIDSSGKSASGFGHPHCLNAGAEDAAAADLTPIGGGSDGGGG